MPGGTSWEVILLTGVGAQKIALKSEQSGEKVSKCSRESWESRESWFAGVAELGCGGRDGVQNETPLHVSVERGCITGDVLLSHNL